MYDAPVLPNWQGMGHDEFEDLVCKLLRRIHPDGHRVDGSGGDSGRDFVVPGATGELVYQIKHFTGRITRQRRRQVESSLAGLDRSTLAQWVLVVPIDLTPGEEDWFAGAVRDLTVPTAWRDLNWLNTEISRHPDLLVAHASSLGAARARVHDALFAIGNDVTSLQQVIDAQQRLNTAADLLSSEVLVRTINTPSGIGLFLTPRDGSVRLDLATLEAHGGEAAADAVRFGSTAVVEGPLELLGIDGSALGVSGGRWTISGSTGVAVEVHLRALGANGRPLGELRLGPALSTVGIEGAQVECSDRSGWLTMRLRIMHTPGSAVTAIVRFDQTPSAYPEDLADLIGFLEALDAAPRLGLGTRILDREFPVTPVPRPSTMMNPVPTGFAIFARAMAELQRLTGVHTPISATHEDIDPRMIDELVRQMNGETLRVHGTATVTCDHVPAELLDAAGHALVFDERLESIIVQDVTYPVGLKRRTTCSHAAIANLDEVQRAFHRDEGCDIRFEAVGDAAWSVVMGEVDAED